MKGDLNDVLREQGPDAVRERLNRAQRANSQTDESPPFTFDEEEFATELPLHAYVPRPFDQIPPRGWLHAKHYVRKTVVMTVAPGGYGKTALFLLNAIEMAIGRGLIGPAPNEQIRVLYWNGEDDEDEVERRIAAICLHHNIEPETLRGVLFLGSKVTNGARLARRDRAGNVVLNQDMIDKITDYIIENEIGCAIFDPLIAFHRVAENSTNMEELVKDGFEPIAIAANCCIELSAHTRKPAAGQGGEITSDDARGSGTTVFAARSVRILNRISKEDAKLPGIPDEDRWRYLRINRDKVNLAPPGKAMWVYLALVNAPNSDEVQAVERWGNCPG